MNKVEEILQWLETNCPTAASSVSLTADARLLDEGVLDSMQIVSLVNFLEAEYGVAVDVDDLVPENFETPGHVAQLVERLAGEKA